MPTLPPGSKPVTVGPLKLLSITSPPFDAGVPVLRTTLRTGEAEATLDLRGDVFETFAKFRGHLIAFYSLWPTLADESTWAAAVAAACVAGRAGIEKPA